MKNGQIILLVLLFLSPHCYATWSSIAVDRLTGEIGIVGASCTLDVSGVASIVPGKGAIVVQAESNYLARMKGVELMYKGKKLKQIMTVIKDEKFRPERQQYGLISLEESSPVVYSGAEINDWSGEKVADDFAVFGNILVSEKVISDASKAFDRNRDKPLANRLMSALKAGEQAGGDKRCKTQYAGSAFIMIYKPEDGAIQKLAIQGIKKGGKPAVTLLNEQFVHWNSHKAAHK